MNTIKNQLLRALYIVLFYVQDFDGLKMKLHLANDSYDSYAHMGGELHYIGLEHLEGDWVVSEFHNCWHHNPKITLIQYNRMSLDYWTVTCRLNKVEV